MQRFFLAAAASLGGMAVALGAFGAHALAARLTERGHQLWTLASHYALLHAAVLLALASLAPRVRGAGVAGSLITAGTLLFCGSLYGLALGGPRGLGPITPLGGLLLLGGWATLLWSAWHLPTPMG